MRGSSRRAQPSRCLPAREKQLHGSLQTARWDAVSPDATMPREAREKTRATCSRRDFTTRLRGQPRCLCSTVSDTSATHTDATTASAPTHLSPRSRVASRKLFLRPTPTRRTASRSTWVAARARSVRRTLDPRRCSSSRVGPQASFSAPPSHGRHGSPRTGVSSRPQAATRVADRRKRPPLQPLRAAMGLDSLKAGRTGDARHRLAAGATERYRVAPLCIDPSASPRFRSQHTDRVVVSVLSQLW